jgi:hypothetical protein
MELDRLLGHPELLGEVRVRVALSHELEDLQLPLREVRLVPDDGLLP